MPRDDTHPIPAQSNTTSFDALIVGAGFSGLYQLLCLRDRLGLSAPPARKPAHAVGGTWYWNRYPGARCNSESHSYAYYFSDELLQEWDLVRALSGAAGNPGYLNYVTDRFDPAHISFNARVTEARYDEAENRWHRSGTGERRVIIDATFLITAVGCLSIGKYPGTSPVSIDIQGRVVPHRSMAA